MMAMVMMRVMLKDLAIIYLQALSVDIIKKSACAAAQIAHNLDAVSCRHIAIRKYALKLNNQFKINNITKTSTKTPLFDGR